MLKKIYERIKFYRQLNGWTQEEIAEKLEMSPSGYGSIERGDTDVSLSRLEKIVEILGIEINDLFNQSGKQVFNLGGAHTIHHQIWYSHLSNEQIQINSHLSNEQIQIKYEFEKQQLIIEKLQQENLYLREIITLLKNKG